MRKAKLRFMGSLVTSDRSYLQAMDCCVHRGFLRRFEQIAATEQYKDMLRAAAGSTVVFTGHSLGGAVALLAALSCKSKCALPQHVLCPKFF